MSFAPLSHDRGDAMTLPNDPLVDDPDDSPDDSSESEPSAAIRHLRVLEHVTEMAGNEPEA